MTEYVGGWLDAVSSLATNEDRAEIADELRDYVCDRSASDAELLIVTRAMMYFPSDATGEGLDCILRRSAEDVVLWTALDAYQAAGLVASGAVNDWAERATDARTIRRLQPRESSGEEL